VSKIVDDAVAKARGNGKSAVWTSRDATVVGLAVEAHYLALLKETEERRDDALADYARRNEEAKEAESLLVQESVERLRQAALVNVAESRLALAVEALRPFAAMARELRLEALDETHVACSVRRDELQRADAALARIEAAGTDSEPGSAPYSFACTQARKQEVSMPLAPGAPSSSSAGGTTAVTHQPNPVPGTVAAESVREGSAGVTPGSRLITEASASPAGRSSSHADDWTCSEATKRALPTHTGFPWWCCEHNTEHCYVCHGTGRAPEKETP